MQFRQPTNLFRRLLLILSACVLPICLFSFISNSHEQQLLKQNAEESQARNILFYKAMMEGEIDRLKNIIYSYLTDNEFLTLSAFYSSGSDYRRTEMINGVREKLSHITQISDYAVNAYAFFPTIRRTVDAAQSLSAFSETDVRALVRMSGQNALMMNDDGRLLICAYSAQHSSQNDLPLLIVAVEIDQAVVQKLLGDLGGDGKAFIIGEQGWCIASDGLGISEDLSEILNATKAAYRPGAETVAYHDEAIFLTYSESDRMDVSFCTYLPQLNIINNLRQAQNMFVLMLAVSLTTIVITTFSTWRLVCVPVQIMASAFHQVETGRTDVRIMKRKRDEFQCLFDGFNHMMDHLNDLMEKEYTSRLLSQQSQLKQLQLQINPHFLYNSFFAVRQMIEMEDAESANYMLENLGNFFRYITRNGRDIVPLSEEFHHAESYLNIQKVRFRNISVLIPELPDELKNFAVPRLILQPLIENAFFHGLEQKTNGGFIAIRFHADDEAFYIEIENNGSVITDEQLENLKANLANPEPREFTGMINIHQRLKLYFGGVAGLLLKKGQYDGLRVVMVLPRRKDEKNVSAFDC